MHNTIQKLLAIFAAVCLAGLLLAPAALADDATNTITLPAKLTLTGSLPASAGPYRFTLEPADPANPMPADVAAGDTKTITVPAAGVLDFGSIEFTNIGDFVYTIRQVPGTAAGVTYDTRVYTAAVYVRWEDEVGGPVTATLVMSVGDSIDKPHEVAFTNSAASVIVPPTDGPDPGPGEPTPVPSATPVPGAQPTPPTSATLQAVLGLLPQTSDEAPLLLFAVLAVASAVVLVVLLLRKRHRNKKDPK